MVTRPATGLTRLERRPPGSRLRPVLAAATLGLLLLGLGTGCRFRKAVRDAREALDEGRPDDALSLLQPVQFDWSGRSDRMQARYHLVLGEALYEISRDEAARSALHAARAADLRTGERALKDEDRARVVTVIAAVDAVIAGEPMPGSKEEGDSDKAAKGSGDASKKGPAGGGAAGATGVKPKKPDAPKAPEPKRPKVLIDKTAPVAVACSGALNTPAAVYLGYAKAMADGNAECVLAHLTIELRDRHGAALTSALEVIVAFEGEVLEETLDGDKASVLVYERLTMEVEGREFISEVEKELPLVKEEGMWRLAHLGAADAE